MEKTIELKIMLRLAHRRSEGCFVPLGPRALTQYVDRFVLGNSKDPSSAHLNSRASLPQRDPQLLD